MAQSCLEGEKEERAQAAAANRGEAIKKDEHREQAGCRWRSASDAYLTLKNKKIVQLGIVVVFIQLS